MTLKLRLRSALRPALLHFLCSVGVAVLSAWLVFGIWYPPPFDKLTGGRGLFLLIVVVDVVCGPILTLILFNPAKSRAKWYLDLSLIIVVQLAALLYGLSQVATARPVFLAFEGNRFRVVQAMDVKESQLSQAPAHLRQLGFSGPRVIGANISKSSDPDFLESLNLSLKGEHPAFRPSRWTSIEDQRDLIRKELQAIAVLRKKHSERGAELDRAIAATGVAESQLGYVPMVRDTITDWVVFVDRQTALPVAYMQIDGW